MEAQLAEGCVLLCKVGRVMISGQLYGENLAREEIEMRELGPRATLGLHLLVQGNLLRLFPKQSDTGWTA